ncbi:hypothetical protein [Enterocloster bolteae]|uniref:hypothetical protein n=1 Tax=Enterocloster bolteae TaxID=208479 RepID=UPI0006722DAF|nr:hypothetical protein [Enterocloster bolteae]KMW20346.1 hypothetical protein HMPREF9472_02208 [Enterocloster bolteae WAL-14578]
MANEHAIQATGTFVVSKGFRLLTKLAASQGSLQFTRAAVGTGKPPEGYSPESMIGLNAYKIDAEIADYGVQDDMAYITVQVSSDNVTEGFLVTEVGVFAEDPDEGEILYGYMDISTDPTYIYANGSTNRSKFAEFTLYVLIGSVSNVIAAVTPGSIITRDTFTAANLKAIDTHGILGGEAGAGTTGQGLIDALTNKLLTEFVTNTGLMERLGTYVLKSKIVNDFLSTDEETVLSGPMGKLLKEQLNVLNTKIACVELDLSAYGITSGQAVRINNVVIITFWHNTAVPTGKAMNAVALPDDFKPTTNKVGTAVYMDSSSAVALGTSIVKPDGYIYLDSAITRVRVEATIAYTVK